MKLTFISAWVLLSLATLLSWGLDASRAGTWAGTAVLLVAFLKARVVLLVFMELGQATQTLRRLCDAWVVVAGAAVIATYWLAPTLSPLMINHAG